MIKVIDIIMAGLGYVSRKREYDILMDENREFFNDIIEINKHNDKLLEKIVQKNEELKGLIKYTDKLEKKIETANDIIDNKSSMNILYKIDSVTNNDILKIGASYMITREEMNYMKNSPIEHENKIKYKLFRTIYEDYIKNNKNFFNISIEKFSGNTIYEIKLNLINKVIR